MKEKVGKIWFPIWIDKWIFGSTRIELEPDERSVWVDLLALSYKDNGYIRANEGTPYNAKQLAGLLVITEELLERTIQKCVQTNKIEIKNDQTLYVLNFETYKLSERHKRRFNKDQRTMAGNADTMAKNEARIVNNSRVNKSKLNKNREREISTLNFIKPSLKEISTYCQERNNNIIPQLFFDYYESNGWMVGRNKMKDWKATIRTWEQRNFGGEQNGRQQRNRYGRPGLPELPEEAEKCVLEALEISKRRRAERELEKSTQDTAPDPTTKVSR